MDNPIISDRVYPIELIWLIEKSVYSLVGMSLFTIYIFTAFIGAKNQRELYVFGGYFILVFMTIPLNFLYGLWWRANFHYVFEEAFINLQQGILSKQTRQLPYGVIQNILVKQNILDRMFGLATLAIENASGGYSPIISPGGKAADTIGFAGKLVSIPGLRVQNAQYLKEYLMYKIKTNPTRELGL